MPPRRCRYCLPVTRLLLVAPTCSRDDVGEPWVAYQWVRALATRHDVTLLTYHKRDRPPVSTELSGLRVIEWIEPPLIGRAERLNAMMKPGYVPFFLRARRWIKDAIDSGERFDIAHQLAPVALRYPSPLTGLGVPFVLGPVGGSLDSPPGFPEEDSAPWYVALRRIDQARLRRDRWLRRTYAEADCVVGIAPYVRDLLSSIPMRRFLEMSDTGIQALPPATDRTNRTDPVRLLFVGRLVRTKGVRDAIRAVSTLSDLPVVLDVLGEGADRAACEALIRDLDLQDRVTLRGRVPRARVDDFYTTADIFLFPSYREPGGLVVAEAMSHGLPVVVCARGGPATAVDDASGIRVDAVTEGQYARDLGAAVRRLVDDPALRRCLGDGARRRVADIGLWERKVDRMDALYREILDRSAG